jgi:hypothetical protein
MRRWSSSVQRTNSPNRIAASPPRQVSRGDFCLCGIRTMAILRQLLKCDRNGYSSLLGTPSLFPHWERLFLCMRVVAFPPFLPIHRGQIILVRGCSGQYVSLATTHIFILKSLD